MVRGSIARAAPAIVRVADARGFIVAYRRSLKHYEFTERLVVTAAHCLPYLPDIGALHGEYTIYAKLLAPLGEEPTVWAECLFADPVADIAVLGPVDAARIPDQTVAFGELVERPHPLRVGAVNAEGWLLSLEGEWFRCNVEASGPALSFSSEGGDFIGGMSGSPIISPKGAAIGVACNSCGHGPNGEGRNKLHWPQPSLTGNLPGWLLQGVRSEPSPY